MKKSVIESGLMMDELFTLYLTITTTENIRETEISNPIYKIDEEPMVVPSLDKLDETISRALQSAKNMFDQIRFLINKNLFTNVTRPSETIRIGGKKNKIKNPFKFALHYFSKRFHTKMPNEMKEEEEDFDNTFLMNRYTKDQNINTNASIMYARIIRLGKQTKFRSKTSIISMINNVPINGLIPNKHFHEPSKMMILNMKYWNDNGYFDEYPKSHIYGSISYIWTEFIKPFHSKNVKNFNWSDAIKTGNFFDGERNRTDINTYFWWSPGDSLLVKFKGLLFHMIRSVYMPMYLYMRSLERSTSHLSKEAKKKKDDIMKDSHIFIPFDMLFFRSKDLLQLIFVLVTNFIYQGMDDKQSSDSNWFKNFGLQPMPKLDEEDDVGEKVVLNWNSESHQRSGSKKYSYSFDPDEKNSDLDNLVEEYMEHITHKGGDKFLITTENASKFPVQKGLALWNKIDALIIGITRSRWIGTQYGKTKAKDVLHVEKNTNGNSIELNVNEKIYDVVFSQLSKMMNRKGSFSSLYLMPIFLIIQQWKWYASYTTSLPLTLKWRKRFRTVINPNTLAPKIIIPKSFRIQKGENMLKDYLVWSQDVVVGTKEEPFLTFIKLYDNLITEPSKFFGSVGFTPLSRKAKRDTGVSYKIDQLKNLLENDENTELRQKVFLIFHRMNYGKENIPYNRNSYYRSTNAKFIKFAVEYDEETFNTINKEQNANKWIELDSYGRFVKNITDFYSNIAMMKKSLFAFTQVILSLILKYPQEKKITFHNPIIQKHYIDTDGMYKVGCPVIVKKTKEEKEVQKNFFGVVDGADSSGRYIRVRTFKRFNYPFETQRNNNTFDKTSTVDNHLNTSAIMYPIIPQTLKGKGNERYQFYDPMSVPLDDPFRYCIDDSKRKLCTISTTKI